MTEQCKAEFEIAYAEEAAVSEAQALIEWAIERAGITQKELAARLDVTESAVSQLLGLSASNLTVRRLGRVLHALGDELTLSTKQFDNWRAQQVPHVADWLATLKTADRSTSYHIAANDSEPGRADYPADRFENDYLDMEVA